MYPKVCTENSHWLPVNWLAYPSPSLWRWFSSWFWSSAQPVRKRTSGQIENLGHLYIKTYKYPNRTRHYYTTNGLPLTSLLQYGSTNLGLLGYQASSEKINRWLILLGIIGHPCVRSLSQGNGAYPLYTNYPQQVLANQNPQSSFVQVLPPFVVLLTPLCSWARFRFTFFCQLTLSLMGWHFQKY